MLPDKLFYKNIDGKRIPHNVNPGPMLVCAQCGNTRCGKDFTFTPYRGEPVELDFCVYCCSKNAASRSTTLDNIWSRD
jgi:hypothetical protein